VRLSREKILRLSHLILEYIENDDQMSRILIELGSEEARLFRLRDKKEFGGQQLTGDISRAYGIPTEEAELKKRSGDLPADYETTVLKPFIDTAATEITRALQFFFTSTPYSRVDQIMLAGGSAVLAGLPDDFFDFGDRQKETVPQLLDEQHAVDMHRRIIGDAGAGLARLSEKPLADIKVDGFLGDAGLFYEFSDSHITIGTIGTLGILGTSFPEGVPDWVKSQ